LCSEFLVRIFSKNIWKVLSVLRPWAVAATLLALLPGSSFALTKEAAIANCRESIGRPFVQSCVRSGGFFESCRAQIIPKVRACVMAALNAANGRADVAVALPNEAAPTASTASSLPIGFSAPPRTIADITAILDSEKPDNNKIAHLKSAADATPTGKETPRGWRNSISIEATRAANLVDSRIRLPMPIKALRSAKGQPPQISWAA
jgi:hypothetical protein